MITVELVGQRELSLRLTSMPAAVRSALIRKTTALSLQLEALVKSKLSGIVLNVVTGALRRSISHKVESGATSVKATVFSSGDVKYAGIHEFGGTIHVPEIVPVKAQALHFIYEGKEIFAKRVRAHDVVMPERSFLRSSLEDMRTEIVAGLREAVNEGLRE